ncbi:MAG: hypothetical protein IT440_03760 [Phycisphaeraceae bacterium]|nr:hypothetical protein [Phycisphaeraceae bacterium]
MSHHGHFDGEHYVLQRVDTPRGWDHLLSNDQYVLQLSQLGSGFSVFRTMLGNRVTRQSWPDDDAGRFLYVRDAATGAFWSPTVWPVEADTSRFQAWSCDYGPGTMEWNVRRDAIKAKLHVAVAVDDHVEMHQLELTNEGDKARTFDLFFFLEWAFTGAPGEMGMTLRSAYDATHRCVVGDLQLPPRYRYWQTGFVASSETIRGWEGNRRDFLGQPGGIAAPLAVRKGKCGNHPGKQLIEPSAAAVQVRIKLPAGKSKTVLFLVGIAEHRRNIGRIARKYLTPDQVESEIQRVRDRWAALHAPQRMEGDLLSQGDLKPWANHWLKTQVVQNFRFTRWAGSRGYRDVLQDCAGIRLIDPAMARDRILEALCHQRSDGYAPRQYPVEPWGKPDWRDYRDSPFWIVYALEKYLKETGDFALLRQCVPFIDTPQEQTVMDHARLALEYLWKHRGGHGLCLIGMGDWLDSLNAAGTGGKGQSIWLTQALGYALRELALIADRVGDDKLAKTCRKRREKLMEAVARAGWDGKWYLMAYNDAGRKIGSASCREGGRIFLNSQSWAVLSDMGDARRLRAAMKACDDHLAFDTGYLCFAPMYKRFDPGIGRITLWPSEGASTYSHAVFFKIEADCVLGEGDRAWETFRKVVPAGGVVTEDDHGASPMTIPNAYMGPAWPRPRWTYQGWWTASAAWALQILVENMYGARAEYDGLRIDPCLPRLCTQARIERTFRGRRYDIHIAKRKGICRGRVRIRLDGQDLPGNLIPASPVPGCASGNANLTSTGIDRPSHRVEVAVE